MKKTCETCRHWHRNGIEYWGGIRACLQLGDKSERFTDLGTGGDFSPGTTADFGCIEWEEHEQ